MHLNDVTILPVVIVQWAVISIPKASKNIIFTLKNIKKCNFSVKGGFLWPLYTPSTPNDLAEQTKFRQILLFRPLHRCNTVSTY